MTAVQWLKERIAHMIHSYDESELEDFYQQALEMEKDQKEKTVLDILNHVLQHDYTARWLAEKIKAGKINVNDL